jgi:hypothetical protein
MHSFARHRHNKASRATARETRGLVLNQGWRYDPTAWFRDIFSFRSQWRELRRRTIVAHVSLFYTINRRARDNAR